MIGALIAVLDAEDAPPEDMEPEREDEGAQCDDEGDDSAWLNFGEFRSDPASPT